MSSTPKPRSPGKGPRGREIRREGAALPGIGRQRAVVDDPLPVTIHVVVAQACDDRNATAVRTHQKLADGIEEAFDPTGVSRHPVIEGEIAADDDKSRIARGGQTQHFFHGRSVLRIAALDKNQRTLERRGQSSEAENVRPPLGSEFVESVRLQSGQFRVRGDTLRAGQGPRGGGRGPAPAVCAGQPPFDRGRTRRCVLPAHGHGGRGIALPGQVDVWRSGRRPGGGQKGGQREQQTDRTGHTRRMFRRASARRGSSARHPV
jgi:hypothetical protein